MSVGSQRVKELHYTARQPQLPLPSVATFLSGTLPYNF